MSKGFTSGAPLLARITFVARVIKFTSKALLTKGKVRLARRLHSITFTTLSVANNWILKGPEIRSADAICEAMRFTARTVCTYSFCAGSTRVASPECTPAFSTCSEMAKFNTVPFCATASNSISLALRMYLEITTGLSGLTSLAALRQLSSSCGVLATDMAAPDSTKEGRMSTG